MGRVMAFAMEHAEGGMGEEVVAVLVANVSVQGALPIRLLYLYSRGSPSRC